MPSNKQNTAPPLLPVSNNTTAPPPSLSSSSSSSWSDTGADTPPASGSTTPKTPPASTTATSKTPPASAIATPSVMAPATPTSATAWLGTDKNVSEAAEFISILLSCLLGIYMMTISIIGGITTDEVFWSHSHGYFVYCVLAAILALLMCAPTAILLFDVRYRAIRPLTIFVLFMTVVVTNFFLGSDAQAGVVVGQTYNGTSDL